MSLNALTLAEAAEGLRARDFTAIELTRDCLDAIEAAAPLNAFSAVTAERAVDQATAADRRLDLDRLAAHAQQGDRPRARDGAGSKLSSADRSVSGRRRARRIRA